MTNPLKAATYASIVSRESVRIPPTFAALNDLEVLSGDVRNAYLNTTNSEQVWATCGVEFGANAGKRAIIVGALYVLKLAGAAHLNHFAICMTKMNYKLCLADPDIWYHHAVREVDGFDYYKYILIYMDDILLLWCMPNDPKEAMHKIDNYFPMKEGSIGLPCTTLEVWCFLDVSNGNYEL
jgi:hypothetical protein